MNTQNTKSKIISFPFKAVSKPEIIEKLQDELDYCKQKRSDTVWFFYHYATGQMQFIDTNKQFREVKELYKSQGYEFKGNKPCVGITPDMVSDSCVSLTYNLYSDTNKDNPMDPLAMLMGRMSGSSEMLIFEMRVNIYKK
jgi:hypothetical protein